MKIQTSMTKPPTLDIAIRKYLVHTTASSPSYPKDAKAVGRYYVGKQYITVYQKNGELVFDLGHLQHRGIDIEVRNTLGKLESYLRRVEYLRYDEQAILKYTKYWD